MTDLGTSIFIDLSGEYVDKTPPTLLSASCTLDYNRLTLIFDMAMIDPSINNNYRAFDFKDGSDNFFELLSGAYGNDTNTYTIMCNHLFEPVRPLTIRYNDNKISSLSGVLLAAITDFEVTVIK